MIRLTSVRLRSLNQTFPATPGGDGDTREAIEAAKEVAEHFVIVEAHVDRFDGLVLVDESGTCFHWRTPLCGYTGSGPLATVEILVACGFEGGDKSRLKEIICQQDENMISLLKPEC